MEILWKVRNWVAILIINIAYESIGKKLGSFPCIGIFNHNFNARQKLFCNIKFYLTYKNVGEKLCSCPCIDIFIPDLHAKDSA
jgi:hypothetical protein